MFSKYLKALAILPMVSFSLLGCDQFLRTSKTLEQENKIVVIEADKEVECLKDVPPQLKRFINDTATANDVAGAVSCIQESLKTFMKYYKGNDPNSYTGDEIQHFFNRYFLKENQITDQFTTEIMKTKTAIVGGVPERFTRDELERFSQFLGNLGVQLQSMRGQMKILLWKATPGQISEPQVLQAQKITQQLLLFFLDNSKLTSAKYELNDLESLLKELNAFIGEQEGVSSIFKWIPLIKDVKYLFLGESSGLSNMTEWKKAFVWVVDAYFAILKFHYHLNKLEFEEPADWDELMIWTDEIFRLIDISPEMQSQKLLEAAKIDALIDRVWSMKLFKKEPMSAELAKDSYRKLIANILESNMIRGRSSEVVGLSQQNFRVLRQEYRVWRISEKFLVDAFTKFKNLRVTGNTRNLRFEADKFDFKKVIASMNATSLEQKELLQSWDDFRDLVFTLTPIIADEKSKMVMDYDLDKKGTSLQGGHLLNFNRTYVRMLVRGYGEKKQEKLFANRVTLERFVNFEEDFWELTRELGLFDKRTKVAATRTFSEADFMSYDGNGDDMLTSTEAIQVLSMMLSGGRHMITELEEDFAKYAASRSKGMVKNCYDKQLDIFGRKIMVESCLKVVYRANLGKYFESMPNTAKFLKSLNDAQFEEYYQAILIPAMLKEHRPGFMELTEARAILVIMHYLESLMVVYDKDKDSFLSQAELDNAFPRFKTFISKMSPAGDLLAKDVFLYLVYKGEKPTVSSLPGFIWDKNTGKLGKVSRLNLVKVLGLLKAESKESLKSVEE